MKLSRIHLAALTHLMLFGGVSAASIITILLEAYWTESEPIEIISITRPFPWVRGWPAKLRDPFALNYFLGSNPTKLISVTINALSYLARLQGAIFNVYLGENSVKLCS